MNVKIEDVSSIKKKLSFEVAADQVDKEISKAFKKIGKTAKIKGFRPGKVPPKVVKQRYGAQIRQEVLSDLMQQSYSDAVQQENLNPAGGPLDCPPKRRRG